MEHQWIAEVLEDICDYSKRNSLLGVKEAVEEAANKARQELDDTLVAQREASEAQEINIIKTFDMPNVVWLKSTPKS